MNFRLSLRARIVSGFMISLLITSLVIVLFYIFLSGVHQQVTALNVLIGLVVDSVEEVVNISDERIKDLSYVKAKINSQYLKGMTEFNDSILIVLDIDKILCANNFVLLKEIQKK